jgi:NAD(P)-dependent dehydrogenase (short-subunit alcohol dehydrogenase family)
VHLASRDKEKLAQAAKALGGDVKIHPADLRDAGQLKKLAADCADLDILVNNAGDIPGGPLEAIDEATWRHAWELKVFGYINLTRIFYERMKARRSGVILNVIGAAGERFDANYITGATGNAALMTFTRALGGRSLDAGVRVVAINPGPVETDRIVTLMKTRAAAQFGDESRYPELMARYPLGRAASPREIADLALFLASDRSAYTSGVVFTVDGGLGARG